LEIKKSYAADLEHLRPRLFLLGFVIALVLLVVALELPVGSLSEEYDEELLDDLAEDIEMLPAMQKNEMETEALPTSQPMQQARLNPVEKAVTKQKADRLLNLQPALERAIAEALTDDSDKPVPPVAVSDNNQVLSLREVERLPEFPGGIPAFVQWLTKNLKYPDYARKQRMQGKVIVSFIIETDGTTGTARIVQSANPHFDSEVMRVIRMMPKWKPGEDHGKPCRTLFVVPVNFNL
jgi:protein TonB